MLPPIDAALRRVGKTGVVGCLDFVPTFTLGTAASSRVLCAGIVARAAGVLRTVGRTVSALCFAVRGTVDGTAADLREAVFVGTMARTEALLALAAAGGAAIFLFRLDAPGDGPADASSGAMSKPNSADMSSSASTLAAFGPVLDSGSALSRLATSSFESVRNSVCGA